MKKSSLVNYGLYKIVLLIKFFEINLKLLNYFLQSSEKLELCRMCIPRKTL
jgi:hypothetical protein